MAEYAIHTNTSVVPGEATWNVSFVGDGAGNPAGIQAQADVTVADAAGGVGDFLITLPTPTGIGATLEGVHISGCSVLAPLGTDATVHLITADAATRTVSLQYWEAGVATELPATSRVFVSIVATGLARQ